MYTMTFMLFSTLRSDSMLRIVLVKNVVRILPLPFRMGSHSTCIFGCIIFIMIRKNGYFRNHIIQAFSRRPSLSFILDFDIKYGDI